MYILDTNVFITAAKNYYPLDFCPGFWEFLITKSLDNSICVARSIVDEITSGVSDDDPLKQWLHNNISNIKIVENSREIQENFGQILTDINTQNFPNRFSQENINNFASVADSWIISTALTHGMTIVTNETLSGQNSTKIKIPNVCNHYNIPYITPFSMLRNLGINLCHQ